MTWSKPLIIAEIGSVHDGSFDLARELVDAAVDAGADVVKFQTHVAEAETLPDAPPPPYFTDEPRFEYFQRTAFSADQWSAIKNHVEGKGALFLSSPFCAEALAMLEDLGAGAYKVPSGEVTNLPLLEKIAGTGKPVLLSTGMGDWSELDRAVEILNESGPLTVMQCSSVYPCPPERAGLNVLAEMRTRYGLRLGFSDHTLGIGVPVAAAALGADVIEKHFTLSNDMYGSDALNAAEPEQFRRMATAVREAWAARDNPVNKDDLDPYGEMKTVFEKSIVTATAVRKGDVFSLGDLAFKKPGDGISAARYRELLGGTTTRDLPENHKLSEEDFD